MMKLVKNVFILHIFIQVVVKTSPISRNQQPITLNKRNDAILNPNDEDKNTTSHGIKISNGAVNETSVTNGTIKPENKTNPKEEEEISEIFNVTTRYEEINNQGILTKLIQIDDYTFNTSPMLDNQSKKNRTNSRKPVEESIDSTIPCSMNDGQVMNTTNTNEMNNRPTKTTTKPEMNSPGMPYANKNEEKPPQNQTIINPSNSTQDNQDLVLPDNKNNTNKTDKIRNDNNLELVSSGRVNETNQAENKNKDDNTTEKMNDNLNQNLIQPIYHNEINKTKTKSLESGKLKEDTNEPFPGK